MILVNGVASTHIDITDRGFQYGDGLFETIEVINGHAVFLDWHLERLRDGCERLLIPAINPDLLRNEVRQLCQDAELAVLKIIVTRGQGGRGYRQPEPLKPTRVLSLHPYPDYPPEFQQQGVTLRFCNTRLGLNPALAGIKHLNRLEQILARAEWQEPAIQEGIMLDIDDNVIECTMSNLFYAKSNSLYTASLESSGVAGIMRSIIISLARQLKVNCSACNYSQAELLAADEAFVCNSILGIWPVKQIEQHSFSIGPITRQLQATLADAKQADLHGKP